jgi:hypothetical protein
MKVGRVSFGPLMLMLTVAGCSSETPSWETSSAATTVVDRTTTVVSGTAGQPSSTTVSTGKPSAPSADPPGTGQAERPSSVAGLPEAGRYVYDVLEYQTTRFPDRTVGGTKPDRSELILTVVAPDATTRDLRYESEGSPPIQLRLVASAGRILWATSGTRASPQGCDWQPDIVYLPSAHPAPGDRWESSGSCELAEDKRAEYELTGSVKPLSTFVRIERTVRDAITGAQAQEDRLTITEDYSVESALVVHSVEDGEFSIPSAQMTGTSHREITLR